MKKVQLGTSDLPVTPVCLGTMTFGEQVDEAIAHAILSRSLERLGVSLLAYSPLGFGLLTGKYDLSGIEGPDAPKQSRIGKFESVRKQRWGRPEALAAARRYNAMARAHGLTPTQLALAFCSTKWQVASTLIGVTSVAQLDEDLDAFGTSLSAQALAGIDKIRWEIRDPAL